MESSTGKAHLSQGEAQVGEKVQPAFQVSLGAIGNIWTQWRVWLGATHSVCAASTAFLEDNMDVFCLLSLLPAHVPFIY